MNQGFWIICRGQMRKKISNRRGHRWRRVILKIFLMIELLKYNKLTWVLVIAFFVDYDFSQYKQWPVVTHNGGFNVLLLIICDQNNAASLSSAGRQHREEDCRWQVVNVEGAVNSGVGGKWRRIAGYCIVGVNESLLLLLWRSCITTWVVVVAQISGKEANAYSSHSWSNSCFGIASIVPRLIELDSLLR